MTSTIFITGGSGFVGRAMRRVGEDTREREVVSVPRTNAVGFLRDRLAGDGRNAAIVHLAWPNLGGNLSGANRDADGWSDFLDWSIAMRTTAASAGAWFIGIGSGIEACAAGLDEPYFSYVCRKSELMTALFGVASARMCWVRLHFMFGPFENPSRIVPSAIRACIDGTEFSCGRRDRRRHWLHVDDVARALHNFAAAPVAGVWDIAGRQGLSFDELLDLIVRAVGRSLRLSSTVSGAADMRLSEVAPVNLSPVVPPAAGLPVSLLAGLRNYASWLQSGRSVDEH